MRRGNPTTILDVARAARVSKATVSLVLNDRDGPLRISSTTRAAVLDAADRLGYTPNYSARSLRRRQTRSLALVLSRLLNPHFAEIARAAMVAAKEHGYTVDLVEAELPRTELEALANLRDRRADGVLIATGRPSCRAGDPDCREFALRDQARQDLIRRGLPLVVLLDRSPEPTVPSIRVDDEAGAYRATRHLIKLGHRRIAHLTFQRMPPARGERTAAADRYRGYRRALAEAGLACPPSWVLGGGRGMAEGREIARCLLATARPRPTAVFVASDLLAIGALRGLSDVGVRVPEDIAVVAFDGIEAGEYSIPTLTTIEFPRQELGRLGLETLIELIEGRQPSEIERVLPTRLLVRESCGGGAAGSSGRGDAPGVAGAARISLEPWTCGGHAPAEPSPAEERRPEWVIASPT
jgi:DNA-binding LacI/PurR family transcriptional regulator